MEEMYNERYMGIQQPFGDEPNSEDSFVVKETTELETDERDEAFESWELGANGKYKARAISRDGRPVRLYFMEGDEFEHYEEGEEFWYEDRSNSGTSVSLNNRMHGHHYIVVQSSSSTNDELEVTVEVWEA